MIIVACSVVIQRDDAILFVEEQKEIAKGKYGLPGGKLELGETLEACAARECQEETGLEVTITDLVAVTQKPHTKEGNNVVRYVYLGVVKHEISGGAEMPIRWLYETEIEQLAGEGKIRGQDVLSIAREVLHGTTAPLPKPLVFA